MDNKERFIEIFTSQIHRPGAAELLEWLESTDFFEAPASTHYHGSYTGGLVEHSLNVYYELIGAGRVPGVPTAETYAVVALLHDIRLTYADGTVEIVEIKSKFVRRMQRDYPVRRRVFLEQIARPAGWKFTEIITAEDKDDLKRWRELAKEG